MFNRYFQQELSNLRDLGAEFSRAHPAVSPMLSGPAADPDVERLLEGTAFLTAQIRQKLDDEFPEILHELVQLIWPHYLRPIPCCAIIAFKPKPALKQAITIQAGIQVASTPLDGTSCQFQTCYDVNLQPLQLLEASYVDLPGKPPAIKISLELTGLTLDNWQPGPLRLYLSGNYRDAADRNLLFKQHVGRIIVSAPENEKTLILGPENLKTVGFSQDHGVIPYPTHSFPAYRILQEYFSFPQKFLFLDITGLDRWSDRGSGSRFELLFELDSPPATMPRIKREDFTLFASPIINLFPYEADPIRLDHRQSEYLIRPAGSNTAHYQIYSVNEVIGHTHGTAKAREYSHFNFFQSDLQNNPIYQISLKKSPIRPGADTYIQVTYPPDSGPPVTETLSLKILCTNGVLPEDLRVGDISQTTSSSPEYADFVNITQPTFNVNPPLGTNVLWRLVSHLSLNHVSLTNGDTFKELLGLYLFPNTRDRTGRLANQKRIDGIEKISSKAADRLVSGIVLRGLDITADIRRDHFAGNGDLYLFGSILDHFFGLYSSINAYTRFILRDTLRGKTYRWKARIGDHPLI